MTARDRVGTSKAFCGQGVDKWAIYPRKCTFVYHVGSGVVVLIPSRVVIVVRSTNVREWGGFVEN